MFILEKESFIENVEVSLKLFRKIKIARYVNLLSFKNYLLRRWLDLLWWPFQNVYKYQITTPET